MPVERVHQTASDPSNQTKELSCHSERISSGVIGTGTAASAAAYRCREAGWRVEVIDHLPFGGPCALRGCDPKKILVGAAEAVDHVRRMQGKGVTGKLIIAWNELLRFKRSFTGSMPQAREKSFAESGIHTFHGRPKSRGRRSAVVGSEVLAGSKAEG